MLISYSATYAAKEDKYRFYEMGSYSFVFYLTHVITILIVANLVFWLKDIDPRFRQGDDADFDDIPSLREHKEKMKKLGENSATGGERVKFQQFMSHAMADLKGDTQDGLMDLKDGAVDMANRMKGVFTGETSIYPGSLGRRNSTSISNDLSRHDNNSRHNNSSGRAYDADTTTNNNNDDDDDDVENGGSGGDGGSNPKALLFKRHKIYTSPNILAEEAEFQSTTIIPLLPQSNKQQHPQQQSSSSSGGSTRYRSGVPTTIVEGKDYNNNNNRSNSDTTSYNNNTGDDDSATVMNPLLQQQQQQSQQQNIQSSTSSSSRLIQSQSQQQQAQSQQTQALSTQQQQRGRELMRSSVQTDDSTGDEIL